jgi:transposase InsO family protein
MPMFNNDGETTDLFIFNHIVARFNISREIVTDHGSHFQNKMMSYLTSNIGLRKEHSSAYYPQANGQVEAINKSLKTLLQQMINFSKSNWHLMLYSTLWAYQMSVKTTTDFLPYQLVYRLEAVLPIECQIPTLNLAVQLLLDTSQLEERLLYLEQLDEK